MFSTLILAQQNLPGGTGIFTGWFLAFVVFLICVGVGFWLWMLADDLLSRKPGNEKFIWFMIILFLNLPGALAYLCIGRHRHSTPV